MKKLAKVKIGQSVDVKIDALPDKIFKGKVTYISYESEFTLKNIQFKEKRTKLVFAVKITIDNPNCELKPGVPADAFIWLKRKMKIKNKLSKLNTNYFRLISAVSQKEIRKLKRDPRLLFVIFFIPVFFIIIFGYSINFDVKHIKLVVYDQEKSELNSLFYWV